MLVAGYPNLAPAERIAGSDEDREASTMRHHRCRHAVFDGDPDDPRTRMYRYQQELWEQLLAKAASERARRPWWSACTLALVDFARATFAHRAPADAMGAA